MSNEETLRLSIIKDHRNPRQKRRTIGPERLARLVADRARLQGKAIILATHGGTVPNCYNYPASTECAVLVGFSDGRVAAWAGRMPANKATRSGALAHCVGDEFRPIEDLRFSDEKTSEASKRLIQLAKKALG